MGIRWYADNIWLFAPVRQKLKAFLTTLPEYPFQPGSLNAAGIDYNYIQATQAMKRLNELESLRRPTDWRGIANARCVISMLSKRPWL